MLRVLGGSSGVVGFPRKEAVMFLGPYKKDSSNLGSLVPCRNVKHWGTSE